LEGKPVIPESKLNKVKSPAHSSHIPLASIIITSYNYAKFLSRAIDSGFGQTYPAKEVIVVDYYRYCGSIKGFAKLTFKVPARCFCRETIWFSIRTLWLGLNLVLGIKKKPRQTKKAMAVKETLRKQHS
jgi:GT2 family glycosyltransferase